MEVNKENLRMIEVNMRTELWIQSLLWKEVHLSHLCFSRDSEAGSGGGKLHSGVRCRPGGAGGRLARSGHPM